MAQPIIVAILAGGAVLLIAASVGLRLEAKSRQLRLHHFIGQYSSGVATIADDTSPDGWQQSITRRLNRYFAKRDYVQATRIDLIRAGFQMKPTRFFVIRLIVALGVALLGWAFLAQAGSLVRLLAMVLGFAVGYMLVRPFLGHRQRKRMDDFEKHLADGLDIMVGGLESGASLTAAVELVSREMPAPLSTEFSRVLRDASLGMSYERAFDGMYERVPSDDVGMLVSSIGVQFRIGGNLASVLRTLSETVRERQRIRGDVKTLTAQQKMTGWLVTGIPVFMVGILIVVNRDYMARIFQPGPQRYVALAGAVMILIGNFVIRRILRIEV